MNTRDKVIELIAANPKGLTINQVKTILKLKSHSLAQYHLTRLTKDEYTKKDKTGKYKPTKKAQPIKIVIPTLVVPKVSLAIAQRLEALKLIIATTYRMERTYAVVFIRDIYKARLDELKLITGLK